MKKPWEEAMFLLKSIMRLYGIINGTMIISVRSEGLGLVTLSRSQVLSGRASSFPY